MLDAAHAAARGERRLPLVHEIARRERPRADRRRGRRRGQSARRRRRSRPRRPRARPATRPTRCWRRPPPIVGPQARRAARRAAPSALIDASRSSGLATPLTRLRHRTRRRRRRRRASCSSLDRRSRRSAARGACSRRRRRAAAQSVVPALSRAARRPPDRATRCWPRSPTTLAWGPLMRKRISRLTAETLPWWICGCSAR